ncbi:hypothetical protein [Rubripirellula reticaptiva]|uniref:Uncharacterized protein n=1 Tax=Rubripirellula reticaptiva TaxID=2528013 RepID=A0A5C6EFC2_9BACT|nr:hypothetical protein [Rubripirellula reticaptiva]TWU46727.1 hypothetical protein Poly59_57000 [Rubripirellula reticaptiva]
MKKSLIAFAGLFAIVAVVVGWQFKPMPYRATGLGDRAFTIECDFDKFRQMMVRLNATKAIVNHGGMELISESVDSLDLDTSKDDRPLLNAIRGTSKSELDATKTIKVSVNDPHIDNTELTLRQRANVSENRIDVTTESIGEQDSIKAYATSLVATANGDNTDVQLDLRMEIEVSVPKMFRSRADQQVTQSVADALAQQQEAITQFVIENCGKRLILPSLK